MICVWIGQSGSCHQELKTYPKSGVTRRAPLVSYRAKITKPIRSIGRRRGYSGTLRRNWTRDNCYDNGLGYASLEIDAFLDRAHRTRIDAFNTYDRR
jgi:hypothetical protein